MPGEWGGVKSIAFRVVTLSERRARQNVLTSAEGKRINGAGEGSSFAVLVHNVQCMV